MDRDEEPADLHPAEQPPVDRFCDVVMKGGVTDGLVYPWAIMALARQYRFQSIGGTSIGAVAAALTADASQWPGPHIVVSGMSNNAGMPWDLSEAKAWIGYEPQDDVWADLKKAGMA